MRAGQTSLSSVHNIASLAAADMADFYFWHFFLSYCDDIPFNYYSGPICLFEIPWDSLLKVFASVKRKVNLDVVPSSFSKYLRGRLGDTLASIYRIEYT